VKGKTIINKTPGTIARPMSISRLNQEDRIVAGTTTIDQGNKMIAKRNLMLNKSKSLKLSQSKIAHLRAIKRRSKMSPRSKTIYRKQKTQLSKRLILTPTRALINNTVASHPSGIVARQFRNSFYLTAPCAVFYFMNPGSSPAPEMRSIIRGRG